MPESGKSVGFVPQPRSPTCSDSELLSDLWHVSLALRTRQTAERRLGSFLNAPLSPQHLRGRRADAIGVPSFLDCIELDRLIATGGKSPYPICSPTRRPVGFRCCGLICFVARGTAGLHARVAWVANLQHSNLIHANPQVYASTVPYRRPGCCDDIRGNRLGWLLYLGFQ